MKYPITFVDAFSDSLFKGNPAAVMILKDWLSDEVMQQIAAENNLSETAFLVENVANQFQIRWFSPLTEIAFCGHATLASATVIFDQRPELANFEIYANAVGKVTIYKTANGRIAMDFPNRAPQPITDVPPSLLKGLSKPPITVLKNDQAYFAIYENESDVLELTTDNAELKTLAPFDVVATAQAQDNDVEPRYDFVSRYFWPANGGDEDPVTGSIHTGLDSYRARSLLGQAFRQQYANRQTSLETHRHFVL